jgi:hypothetical protein
MIETKIKWYTLSEKLPYDGEKLTIDDECDILCLLEFKVGETILGKHIQHVYWVDKKVMMYNSEKLVDYTEHVKYWTYVPEIGVE